jgi:hypothetical protein
MGLLHHSLTVESHEPSLHILPFVSFNLQHVFEHLHVKPHKPWGIIAKVSRGLPTAAFLSTLASESTTCPTCSLHAWRSTRRPLPPVPTWEWLAYHSVPRFRGCNFKASWAGTVLASCIKPAIGASSWRPKWWGAMTSGPDLSKPWWSRQGDVTEAWLLMELCSQGSLQRWIDKGYFKDQASFYDSGTFIQLSSCVHELNHSLLIC